MNKDELLKAIQAVAGEDAAIELTVPEEEKFGHYATNLAMRLGKKEGKPPLELAASLAAAIMEAAPAGLLEKAEAAPPGFINFWFTNAALQNEFAAAAVRGEYGRQETPSRGTVIVEYSQPNIAKMMHVGHLRTTIIGDALANILSFLGYQVIRWNYLGDWGTQFGKLIAAYKLWGDEEAVRRDPIATLQELYVRFHDEMKKDESLEKRGQEEFKKLEDGDPESRKLWQWFRDESLKEFERAYKALGVHFDIWIGESFFEPEMRPLVAELVSRGIAKKSEGSLIIDLEAQGLPPALIEKSDGASLYLTRDIANIRYRLKEYKPEKILYVVGNEQSLHFEQLFAIAKLLGLDGAELAHLKYGLVLGEEGKKLATREGRTILLKDVLGKAITLAREIVEEKNPELSPEEKSEVANAVAVGALKYNDLKENRMTDITFDWGKMLDFTGDSGPYLQYTYARLMSILRKAEEAGVPHPAHLDGKDVQRLDAPNDLALMRKIFEFPDAVARAGERYATSVLAVYLYKLASAANHFYETTPIMKDEDAARRDARLVLVGVTAHVLKSGMGLLGITALEKI